MRGTALSAEGAAAAVAAVVATASLLALRWLVEITTGPLGGWIGDRFGARRIAIANACLLVGGFVLIAAGHDVAGALLVVMTRGMFNTLIPVLVIERGPGNKGGGVLSSQASYSTWRDFGAAVGPLSEKSVKEDGMPQVFPDFTRGNWKTTKPLGIIA